MGFWLQFWGLGIFDDTHFPVDIGDADVFIERVRYVNAMICA